jgi:hypothetical protein
MQVSPKEKLGLNLPLLVIIALTEKIDGVHKKSFIELMA